MLSDGDIDFSTYTRAQLEDALQRIDGGRYPLNYHALVRELATRPPAVHTTSGIALRPRQVTLAVNCLWTAVGLGFVRGILLWPSLVAPRPGYFQTYVVIGWALSLLFSWWILAEISLGRNWARMTLFVFWVFGALLLIWQLAVVFLASRLAGAAAVVGLVLDVAAMYLLFTEPASSWFKADESEL
jgi:hypothetical protein